MATILIVDDTEYIRRLLKMKLEILGYKVLEASNGVQALEIVRTNGVDLILLDQMMPEMSGFDFFNLLKETIHLHPPTIMMTAYSNMQLAIEFMKAGGADYLQKPIDLKIIEIKIEQQIENWHRLKKEIVEREEAERKLEEYRKHLEFLIEERTAELKREIEKHIAAIRDNVPAWRKDMRSIANIPQRNKQMPPFIKNRINRIKKLNNPVMFLMFDKSFLETRMNNRVLKK